METNHRESSWNIANADPRLQTFLLVCLVAVLSYLTARLGGALVIRPQTNWPFWPGNVIVVSILLYAPRRIWPIVMAAAWHICPV